MFVYSYIFTIIAILILGYALIRYHMRRISLSSAVVLSGSMIFVILFSLFPFLSSIFAMILGINRGLDFVFIACIAVLVYIIARLYFIIEDLQRDMDKIVKEVALKNEIDE